MTIHLADKKESIYRRYNDNPRFYLGIVISKRPHIVNGTNEGREESCLWLLERVFNGPTSPPLPSSHYLYDYGSNASQFCMASLIVLRRSESIGCSELQGRASWANIKMASEAFGF